MCEGWVWKDDTAFIFELSSKIYVYQLGQQRAF